jgi:purine-binding chemotaxis protein CheW
MAKQIGSGAVGEQTSIGESLAGKYLTFRLANEEYGIPILTVVEIIKMMEVTPVPRTPSFVRGVVNLRGKVIPVVELREKFGMEHTEDTDETCIIVVKLGSDDSDLVMGIIIDTVSEVLDIQAQQIEPAPEFGSTCDTEFILGMAKAGAQVKILIDINRVLSREELSSMGSGF